MAKKGVGSARPLSASHKGDDAVKAERVAMPAERAHRAQEHTGVRGVLVDFLTSFKQDRRFLKMWGYDALFWACVALIAVILAVSYNDVMSSIDSLRADMGEQTAVAAWSSFTSYVTILITVYVSVFLLFIFFQTLLWRVLVPHKVTLGALGRFLLFCVVALPVMALYGGVLFYLVSVATTMSIAVFGTLSVVVVPAVFVVFMILSIPLFIWPYYGFFKEARVWSGLGRACWAGLSTMPALWPHYILAGIVLGVVTTLWGVLTLIDFWLGTFAGAILLAGPLLAWLRIYVVRMIEKHEQW
jgi:hypothetical protein